MLALYVTLLKTDEQRSKFEYIYNKYRGFMYHIAFGTMHDQYLAEDAVHETFLNLIRIIDEVRVNNEKELMSFLKIITYHQTVDMIRKRTSSSKSEEKANTMSETLEDYDVESVVLSNISYETMLDALSQMDEKYKSPLLLRVQGYKINEIAKILNVTTDNTKVRLHRARKILLSKLEETNG